MTLCHSDLHYKCCQKTSVHQTQWVMTSGDGDRWVRDMVMTLSVVWDHKKPHGSENSYEPLPTANCPNLVCAQKHQLASAFVGFETGRWPEWLGERGENMEFFALITTCFYFYVSFPLNALLVVEPDCTWNGTAKLNRPQLSLFCFFCICHYLLFCFSYFPVLLLFLVIPHIEQVSNV